MQTDHGLAGPERPGREFRREAARGLRVAGTEIPFLPGTDERKLGEPVRFRTFAGLRSFPASLA
jgi:hypothetical protein